jgi:hypothetical protein
MRSTQAGRHFLGLGLALILSIPWECHRVWPKPPPPPHQRRQCGRCRLFRAQRLSLWRRDRLRITVYGETSLTGEYAVTSGA